MNSLRWILATVLIVCMGGFIGLSLIAGGFRRSFGASDVNPLITIGPVVSMILLLLGLLLPSVRPLLHAAGVATLLLIGLSFWQIFAASASILWFAQLYFAFYLIYYWQTAWAVRL